MDVKPFFLAVEEVTPFTVNHQGYRSGNFFPREHPGAKGLFKGARPGWATWGLRKCPRPVAMIKLWHKKAGTLRPLLL
jgi:hypothetical protein